MYKNSKGYPDPTAGIALEHIEYEEYLKKRSRKSPSYEIARIVTIRSLPYEKNDSLEHFDCQVEH